LSSLYYLLCLRLIILSRQQSNWVNWERLANTKASRVQHNIGLTKLSIRNAQCCHLPCTRMTW
jgi:hypothetical protein